ncbi:MAG TPA: HlyD family efflux transporter periplasmic adaptor subunit [Spongiibacteraceae bacterium]|jgi:putative peptide zinc metalloprotease protein
MALPPLRQELSLLEGPPLADGQPTHTLHDPVRNLYFQIDWPSFEILSHWDKGEPELIVAAVCENTTLNIDAQAVLNVAQFFADNELLQPAIGSSSRLAERLARKRGSKLTWLLHNYLFFRIPLWRPDAWLSKFSPLFAALFTPTFRWLTLFAFIVGVIEIARDWDRFTATLVDTISLQGLLGYGIALIAVKFAHELGHAITAKRYGCRVPTMGIAFLVMWPVAYTDTNDVWRLRRKRERLAVAAAGVITELTIAAWALFFWAWLPEGLPRATAFLLATTTWISTILVNASPFMRFDGYFLLSDWLEIPNLHARAFALARWKLRELLFDLREEPPEYFPPRRQHWLILFAWGIWIYRLVLFLGIAALVYHFFIKAVGIVLFAVEIGVFVTLPIVREIIVWHKKWSVIRLRRRSIISGAILAAVLLLFAVPLPTRIHASALLQPQQYWVVYAPEGAQIEKINFRNGDTINAGKIILQMSSPKLQMRTQQLAARAKQTQWLAEAGTFDSEQRAHWQSLQMENSAALAEIQSITAQSERFTPKAPFNGVLRDIEPELSAGQWVTAKERLATLVAPGNHQVIAYIDEQAAKDLQPGAHAHFYGNNAGTPTITLRVIRIDADASRTLAEPALSNRFGGDIVVREKSGVLYPEQALYRVTLQPIEENNFLDTYIWRGNVTIDASWSPLSSRFFRSAVALIWREAGF